MRAAGLVLGMVSVALGAVRLWLHVRRPAPSTFRGRLLRGVLDVVLVIAAFVVVGVLLVVALGVLREVSENV